MAVWYRTMQIHRKHSTDDVAKRNVRMMHLSDSLYFVYCFDIRTIIFGKKKTIGRLFGVQNSIELNMIEKQNPPPGDDANNKRETLFCSHSTNTFEYKLLFAHNNKNHHAIHWHLQILKHYIDKARVICHTPAVMRCFVVSGKIKP